MKFFIRVLGVMMLQLVFHKASAKQYYFFTNYTIENGLSNNTVHCIVKDSEGFIWIGTEAGLNRFNGYDFVVYKSLASDSTTLLSNSIQCLLSDKAGNLWIGTSQGICLYNRKDNNFIRLHILSNNKKPVSRFETFCLFEDSKGNIWAGVATHGLIKYEGNSNCFLEKTNETGGPVNAMVTGIVEDRDGSLWLSNYYSVLYYNSITKNVREIPNRISKDNSQFQGLHIYQDRNDDNFLWIVTWGSGLVHFNKQSEQFTSYKFRPDGSKNLDNIIWDIKDQGNNALWLATNEGVAIFDTREKKYGGLIRDSINAKPIINGETHCIYKDDEGITWMGSVGGVCNIHPLKQNFVKELLWLNGQIDEYYYDEDQNKIYGLQIYSNRSLVINDKKSNKVKSYKIPDADKLSAEPFSAVKDNNGLLWIATTKGIYTFDESKEIFSLLELEKEIQIPDRSVYARQVLKDSIGNLWFSCYARGLLMVEPNTKKITRYFHVEDGFPLVAVTKIAAGKGKTIYACDEKNGVVKFDYEKNEILHFNPQQKKYSVLYNAGNIGIDRDEQIWITTRNNGLVCIDKNNTAVAYTKDEFGNIIDEQGDLAIDAAGKVWFAASNGIYFFDPALKSFSGFSIQEGLPSRSARLDVLNNGKLSMHVPQGIFSFDPLHVSKPNSPLQVHLNALLVNGKISEFNSTIDQLDTLYFKHSENNITVEFAATDFAYPSSALYSYKLDGIDNSWSIPSRTRTINYSQLPPGNYLLRIRSGISDDNSEHVEKKIFIGIIPAWWQTAFFKWSVFILGLVALTYGIRFFTSLRYKQQIAKLEQQRQIENIRMRISRDIHDEIGSGLTKIKLMSRNLAKAKEQSIVVQTTDKITTASDELIQNLGEIVWTINPANDTIENVFAFARNYVSKLFDENPEIKSTLMFTEPGLLPQNVHINPEVKRNMLLILKEALTNIIKHSEANEVTVSMHADKTEIKMQIKDNGKGIDISNTGVKGNGLINMKKRAQSVKADFEINTIETGGTSIFISVPINPS
jgi:signal transduction histidine kinase/ligand-binding sensor domain-containing protein